MKLNYIFRLTAVSLSVFMLNDAGAHITLQVQAAEAGTRYRAVFQVPHGCENASPIRKIVVDIPEGVLGAKPMAKAGWKLEVEKAKLAQPYTVHGVTITEYVTQVRWTDGILADAHYDEFVVISTLPERTGPLYWKVRQVCDEGKIDWADVPADGKILSDYKTPAAVVELTPKKSAGHKH